MNRTLTSPTYGHIAADTSGWASHIEQGGESGGSVAPATIIQLAG